MRAATYLQGLLKDVVSAHGWSWPDKAGVEPPRDRKFGDLASNVAMMLAGQAGQKPRDVAETIKAGVMERAGEASGGDISSVDIAGPGFLNFTFAPGFWQRGLVSVVENGPSVPDVGQGEKVQIEYVSANPTGPLHVGHGRGAALGDALARIMERAGYDVECEYYINDAGRQTMLLGLSILYRLRQAKGQDPAEPEDYYRGEYIKDLAAQVAEAHPDILDMDEGEALATARDMGMALVIETIKADLNAFNVRHDVWFSEKSLVQSGKVQETFEDLKARGMAYEADGALWFKSTELGDDKDRVLIKSSGDITYFASDIAYHDNKYKRGFERVVNIWGADHHGYVPRMQAAVKALGHEGKLDVILVQLVNLLRGGEPVSMGKRSGSFETLRDLIDEVGPEAARFIFLTRKSDSKLDFDLDVVKQRSMDNPVYYVQYAHARIHSVYAKAREEGLDVAVAAPPLDADLKALTEPEELDLLKLLDQYEDAVAGAASGVSPHLVGYYLQELASALHKYYTMHHVLTAGPEVRDARLLLLAGVARVLAEGLSLLGVKAPESM